MTLRLAKISGTLSRSGKFRLAAVTGAQTLAPPARLRLANISGTLTLSGSAKLRIAKVSGSTVTAIKPLLAPISLTTIDPVLPVSFNVATTNQVALTSLTATSPGIAFTVSGNTVTFNPPGGITGGTVTVTVIGYSNGVASDPLTVNFILNPSNILVMSNGAVVPASLPYYQH